MSVSLGFGILSEAILGTGEILPQQPRDTSKLLTVDRHFVQHVPEGWATPASNVGMALAFTWTVLEPIVSGFQYGREAAIVDALVFAEVLSITWSATNLAKIAFRRPRPSAYREQAELYAIYGQANAPDIAETNSALSFFSGHAALTASVTAAASYLAFTRSPNTARPWVTLGIGIFVTAATSYARVVGGHHFPTDVIAGVMAGAGIGLLVPHLHREESARKRPFWIGFSPEGSGGGQALIQGVF